jgi:hypothetical protein
MTPEKTTQDETVTKIKATCYVCKAVIEVTPPHKKQKGVRRWRCKTCVDTNNYAPDDPRR